MVLPAVLRHPPCDSGQAWRRHRDVRLDPHPFRAAVARHVEGTVRNLPPAVQGVLLAVYRSLHRPRLSGFQTSGGMVCHFFAPSNLLLFLPFPSNFAFAGTSRDAETDTVVDLG